MIVLLQRAARKTRRVVKKAVRTTGVHRYVLPRRTDVCSCGISKTGTHSVAGLFSDYRGGHHVDAEYLIELATSYLDGRVSVRQAETLLRRRDQRLWLEIESSTLMGVLIRPAVRACPDKKFIVTIRDVYSWFNSWADHNINSPPRPGSRFGDFDRVRLRGNDYPPSAHDHPLTSRGMESLEAHFAMWARHYSEVLGEVPRARCLVVKTDEILSRLDEIAAFAGVPASTLRRERGWLNVTPHKNQLLSEFDPGFVTEVAERHCQALMSEYFGGPGFD